MILKQILHREPKKETRTFDDLTFEENNCSFYEDFSFEGEKIKLSFVAHCFGKRELPQRKDDYIDFVDLDNKIKNYLNENPFLKVSLKTENESYEGNLSLDVLKIRKEKNTSKEKRNYSRLSSDDFPRHYSSILGKNYMLSFGNYTLSFNTRTNARIEEMFISSGNFIHHPTAKVNLYSAELHLSQIMLKQR